MCIEYDVNSSKAILESNRKDFEHWIELRFFIAFIYYHHIYFTLILPLLNDLNHN